MKLKSIDLTGNEIGDRGVRTLSKAFAATPLPALEMLSLGNKMRSVEGALRGVCERGAAGTSGAAARRLLLP